ncbi:FAD-dependent oxidoreductase [Alicyclobacillus sp.]|uniref:FAD-dependent oxidoreductase n=1 Tax=Alicyclobacillus sp. TaxID=61169 RepID=UPI0025C72DFE|nr:FAD-dependent oxidoreductase [Alicyclobacillus sp.]MCL6517028.1 FAD-dependent oxidoreductase [Alicyclobacillus sp.]
MDKPRFDAIVVGAGPAGSVAAYTMAKQGLRVALIERGEFPGAKNVFGGVLYRKPLEDIIPEFWKEAPLERRVVEQRLWVLGHDSVVGFSFRSARFQDPPNAWTGQRAKFDAWLAGKAEQAGATPIYETTVTSLIREGGRVVGVRTDREDGDLYAPVTVIADGVNSMLAKSLGVHREWRPDQVSLAVKEVLALPRGVIEERFGVRDGDGVTIELVGETFGMAGLGFLYTNQDTLSLGVGVMVSDLREKGVKPYQVLDHLKQHPEIRRLIEGAETKEYAAHLIPEGGFDAMPPLAGDGWMVCGDAAQMVNAAHREGTDLAMLSGRLAGETAVACHGTGDWTVGGLGAYTRAIRNSIIQRDLKKYRGLHGLLAGSQAETLFGQLPQALNDAVYEMLSVDGQSKQDKQKRAMALIREAAGGTAGLAGIGWRGWRAMNG